MMVWRVSYMDHTIYKFVELLATMKEIIFTQESHLMQTVEAT